MGKSLSLTMTLRRSQSSVRGCGMLSSTDGDGIFDAVIEINFLLNFGRREKNARPNEWVWTRKPNGCNWKCRVYLHSASPCTSTNTQHAQLHSLKRYHFPPWGARSIAISVSVCLFVCPFVRPSVRLSVCLSVSLFVCLSVCLSVLEVSNSWEFPRVPWVQWESHGNGMTMGMILREWKGMGMSSIPENSRVLWRYHNWTTC